MNLRLSDGLDLRSYELRWGRTIDPNRINELERHGLVRVANDRMAATRPGRLVLNSLVEALAA
jgi:oxygen-independent coproporphyrinogen-3 oxidase